MASVTALERLICLNILHCILNILQLLSGLFLRGMFFDLGDEIVRDLTCMHHQFASHFVPYGGLGFA